MDSIHQRYGLIPSTASPLDPSVCFGNEFDAEHHFGVVRKSQVMRLIKPTGISEPTQEQLDYAASLLVFTSYGLTDAQALARAQTGKFIVKWANSPMDLFGAMPDHTWDVPVAAVTFKREFSSI